MKLLLAIASILMLSIGTISGTRVKLTYYWVVHENDFPLGSEAKLNTCSGQNLALTSRQFADRIALEGSGYLRDRKTVLNLGGCVSDSKPCKRDSNNNYNCFEYGEAPVGSNDNPLIPYVSVASNDISFGTVGIIEQFVGKKTPQGETHNGCVRVDDSCSTCTGNWLDFYAFAESNYEWFNDNWSLSNVDFVKQSCTLKTYKA